MLIKLNEGSYISNNAIHEVCIMHNDEKAVRLYGKDFKFVSVFNTNTEADTCLIDIVSKLNNNSCDLSAYTWNTFEDK